MSEPLRRVLIVSPHFPPVNAPDMQRVRMSLPYYRAAGWEAVVLCVNERWQDGTREPALLETVPADVRVVGCRALSLGWTRRLGLRNLGLRTWPYLLVAGARLLRRERFDLVFFSNTQFITFTLGRIWRWWFGVPYVLDVQDPWRTDYYERPGSRPPPGGWKYKNARFIAWLLEGWSFARAAGVMSVSPGYIDDLRARHSALKHMPSAVIRFGASAADLAVALRSPAAARFARAGGEVHFVYTGASGPVMPHALTVLFDAVRQFRGRNPARGNRLRFHFLGTSYVAPGQGTATVLPLAERCGVADLVTEVPHRLGHLECLRLQHEADVLLLPGSSDTAYSPSKTYPYFLSGRPILGLVFRDSVLERLLRDLGGAWIAAFSEREDRAACLCRTADRPVPHGRQATQASLHQAFDLALDGRLAAALPPRQEASFRALFLAESLTGEQCRLFACSLAAPGAMLSDDRA